MDEVIKVCHDKVLPRDLSAPQTTTTDGNKVRAVFEFRKMWVNGSTLSVRFMGGTAAQQALAKQQALWWTEHANLKFDFNNKLNAEIRITFDPTDGAWSYIGTDCASIPQNLATMNLGFMDGGTAGHEFGHAIGLGHEHQNPDGGIQWNRDAVIRDLSGPPNSWTVDQIEHNVLEKYSVDQIRGTQFDRESIMLYFFPSRWTLNGIGTPANETLSAVDKAFIASQEAYPGTAAPITAGVKLTVNGAATPAKIGVPGEEDLFTFTVPQTGRYTVETTGQTDLVMKLFGPNSPTSLIAQDDDAGAGLNPRIVARLAPGQYFVQIRHFNKARGTGSYSIKVKT